MSAKADPLAEQKSAFNLGLRIGLAEGHAAADKILADVQQTLGELAYRVSMACQDMREAAAAKTASDHTEPRPTS